MPTIMSQSNRRIIGCRLRIWCLIVAASLLPTAAALAQGPNGSVLSPADESSSLTAAESAGAAQPDPSESFDNTAIKIGRTIADDELHILKAPFEKDAIVLDFVVLGSTAALAATDADERIAQDVPISWHQTNRDISNAMTFGSAAIAGGIYLTGLLTKNEHEQEVGLRTAESTVDSVILYAALKAILQRQRPYTGPGEGKFFSGNWSNGSFPSGHAMFTWTIAATVAHQYHSLPLDLLLYGMASTVSVTRVTAGQHFPSDVIVGSVLGYLIGNYVSHKPGSGLPIPIRESKFVRVRDAVLEHVAIGVQ
jgi:membrane-associated phospholipid phosphatase